MRSTCLLVLAAALLCAAAPPDDTPRGEDVRFPTADGLSIAATWYPPLEGTATPAPVVIALPMYKHTRGSWAPMVRPVTDRGMGLLTLDLRGHGDSAKQGDEDLSKKVETRDRTLNRGMHQDVDAAIAWLAAEKKTPTGKIVLLGASFSCSVAIDTTVLNPDPIAAVVCLTPNGTVGDAGFGMPTMDRLPKWPHGKPLLAVSSDEDAVFSLELLTKLGDDARMRKVADSVPVGDAKARSIRGTDMFGRVPDVEDNVADWIALHVAFRRVDLGDGVTAVLGSTGTALYVGVETPPGAKTTLDALAVRVGLGPVTDPWSKSETIEVGKRLSGPTEDAAARRRTRIARDRLGAESGKPFAVQISLDGRKFLPAAGEPALLFSLR